MFSEREDKVLRLKWSTRLRSHQHSSKHTKRRKRPHSNYVIPHCCCLLLLIILGLSRTAFSANSAPAKNSNAMEGSGLPGEGVTSADWEASGANPDDEPGDDVEKGSGDGLEGSGMPVVEQNMLWSTNAPSISTTTAQQMFVIEQDKTVLSSPALPQLSSTTESIRQQTNSLPSTTDLLSTATTTTALVVQSVSSTIVPTTKRPYSVNIKPSQVSPPHKSSPPPPSNSFPPYVTEADSFEMLKPGILAAVSGGAVVGVLMTILLVMFIVYRMRKKDEGSYSLEEQNQPPNYSYAYQKTSTKEFYA